MKVGAVLFIRGGRRISISRYGSCETSRIEDSEGVALHLETLINLTGKKGQKKKNLRQTRAMPCVRFRFLLAEMGGCHSCTQQYLLPGGLYYNYYVNGFP